MAKKATAENIEVAPKQKAVVQAKKVPTFEYKDRNYYISTGKSPLIYVNFNLCIQMLVLFLPVQRLSAEVQPQYFML